MDTSPPLHYDLTKADLLAFHRDCVLRKERRRDRRDYLQNGLAVASACSLLIYLETYDARVSLVLGAVLAPAVFYTQVALQARSFDSWASRATKHALGPYRLTLDETGIRVTTPHREVFDDWSRVEEVHTTPTHIFIYTRVDAFIVPRHGGSPDLPDLIEALRSQAAAKGASSGAA